MDKCTIWMGHKFEARYDVGEVNPNIRFDAHLDNPVEFMESLKPKKYVHDVCVRCGATVERPK